MVRTRLRRFGIRAVAVLAVLAVPLVGGPSFAQPQHTLDPIGGGYTTDSLQGFARVVAQHATGSTVDIQVVPAAYGTEPTTWPPPNGAAA